MPTYLSNKMQPGVVTRAGMGVQSVSGTYTIATTLILNDLIHLCRVPANAVIRDIMVSSNGTQSGADSVFTVGDSVDEDRFITTAAGLSFRTGGGVARLNATTGLDHQYADETIIYVKLTTLGTGQTTGGVVRFVVIYDMQK
jgi:hypothetical protein